MINLIFFRVLVLFLISITIQSCSSYAVQTSSVEEETGIILEGELIGLRVEINNSFSKIIENKDLFIDKSRSSQFYDRRRMPIKFFKYSLKQGNFNLKVFNGNNLLMEKDSYLSLGQVMRIPIELNKIKNTFNPGVN